jgi:hypothetical protein
MVTRSPAAINGAVGFIIIHADTYADAIVISVSAGRYNAARQEDRQRPDSKCEY